MTEHDWLEYDVVVVDDEEDNLDAFRFAFRKSFRLHYAKSGAEALDLVGGLEPAVVIADQRMPGMSGIDLLRRVKALQPECYAILLTAYAELQVLIDAVNSGAVDRYVAKPWDSKEFPCVIRQGIAASATLRENRRLRDQLAQYAAYLDRLQRAAVLARADGIEATHLEHDALTAEASGPLGDKLEAFERDELARALALHGGNKAEVARALGIHRTTLYYRLRKLGLES